MEQTTQDRIAAITAKDSWNLQDCRELLEMLESAAQASDKFKAILGEMESAEGEPRGAAALKIGIARYALGRFQEALDVLAVSTDNQDRHYVQGLCYKNLAQYDRAIEEFQRAADRGWDTMETQMAIIECQALGGDPDTAGKALDKLQSKVGESADYYYLRGLIDELKGWGERACEAYTQARTINPSHADATFRLAFYYDLHGEEGEAVDLYRQCTAFPMIYANALLNLAVLYEDEGQYDEAALCLRRILANNPNHARARLFLKDVEAAKTMYFDEDRAKRIAKRNAVLDIPVTDFELSVRARNCLKKMNIRSLGDLVMTTESELLAYKNFGETSLREIKEMLAAKGLHLGQELEEADGVESTPAQAKADNEALLATPLERIDFSVRIRSALEALGVTTLGELTKKSEAELLAHRNFGQSSLNEVRQRLEEYGLRLREVD
ncbi:MAG: tetratricopeptide repeat protein [Planctomycetes bacterium]|nr:tetratricopeptide repeat protein [Planctomycetota bacterium]